MSIPEWLYEGKLIEAPPEGSEAFVYEIVFEDGTRYIGKKNLTSTRRKKLVGKVRRQVTVSESNWRTYLSSSDEVKRKIREKHVVTERTILKWCTSKAQATWQELVEMISRRVLCDEKYLNKNILGRFFKCYE